MRLRRIDKIFVSIVVPIASMCATLILLYVFVSTKVDPVEPNAVLEQVVVEPGVVTADIPLHIEIGNIAVAAAINPVGLTADGDMDIENDPTLTAWYQLGPKPGEVGSAVIAGHYGWKDGVPSVFNDLNKLVVGDVVSVQDQTGTNRSFRVTRMANYAPEQDATSVFTSSDGRAHLNLITCQGEWSGVLNTYSERLVVFTDLIE